MADMGAIAAAFASLKAAGEITSAMIGLRDATLIQNKVIELNTVILAAQASAFEAQTAQSALLERVRGLEKEVAELEAWDAEKQRYHLTDLGNSNFALSLKPDAQGSEPPHEICANCYQDRHKSILRKGTTEAGRRTYFLCQRCNATLWPHGGGPELFGKSGASPVLGKAKR